jgi:hypothetical protein
MGIVKQQTLGNTTFALVDDVYPQFTASTSIIAVNNYGRIFTNIPNSSMWIPMEKQSFIEMSAWDINLNSSWAVGDNGIWYVWGQTLAPMSSDTSSSKDFVLGNVSNNFVLSAKTDTLSRCLITQSTTLALLSNASDEMNMEFGNSFGLSVPTWGINGGCIPDRTGGLMTGYSTRILNFNGDVGNFTTPTVRLYVGGGVTTTGGIIVSKNIKMTAKLLEEPTYLIREYWSGGETNGWTTVNGSEPNQWIIASGNSYSGDFSAYVSNDGVNNTYTGVTSITHIYKDVVIPKHTPSTFMSLAYKAGGTGGRLPGNVPNVSFTEDWEGGAFGTNSWLVANAATNAWYVGTATNNGGTFSAYISNNGGVTNTYTINVTQVSHFYRDITFPDGKVTLKFDWKSWAENGAGATSFDYGAVVITNTTVTPVAGSEVSTAQATSGGNGRIGASTNLGKFNSAYGGADNNWRTETIDLSAYSGQTKRLVFTWRNDNSVGNNPPFAVDNISISGLTGGVNIGGSIYLAPTSVTPVAGEGVLEIYKVGSTVYSGQINFVTEQITLDLTGSISDTTRRLIFTWANDDTTASNPPFNIDNLKVYTWVQLANDKI